MGFLGSLVGGVIGGGTSMINSKRQADVARENTDKTIAAQRALAEYSYSKDVEMWNRQNEYNSPSAQMSRLDQAGLNPNMIYGSGSAVGNTSSQIPKYQAYNPQFNNQAVQLPDMFSILGMFQDLKIKKAQTDNVGEDIRRKQIENFYLADSLGYRNMSQFYNNLLSRNLYGQSALQSDYTDIAFANSPYMKRFGTELARTQATTKQAISDSLLKDMDLNLAKKGVSRSDNLLLRMLIQSGLWDKAAGVLNKYSK